MNEGSGALAVWILVPLFVAVGLYLVWYSRRRKKMLEAFAKAHQFRITAPFLTWVVCERIDISMSLEQYFTIR